LVDSSWISILSLLDANLDPELQAEIGRKIAGIGGAQGVPEFRVRRSGPFRMTVGKIIQAYREKRVPILTAPTHSLEESEAIMHETGETKEVGP
jgi:divalent metal cation (Fe/Co/Zn/Cd) transporter